MPLFLLAVACIEVFGLIRIGRVIGGTGVLGVILLTAVLGLVLLRLRGGTALTAVVVSLFAGRVSPRELLRRRELSLLLGGILLIIPGLLSDALGLGLVARYLFTRGRPQRSVKKEPDVIDVEFEVHDDSPRE